MTSLPSVLLIVLPQAVANPVLQIGASTLFIVPAQIVLFRPAFLDRMLFPKLEGISR
jgi:hypothetical protein